MVGTVGRSQLENPPLPRLETPPPRVWVVLLLLSLLIFLILTFTILYRRITHVLVKAGFPPWFRNFVKGSLTSVKVAPFFGGDLTEWIDILRGVKQGCPLSPLLFIIAYDPLLVYVSKLPNTLSRSRTTLPFFRIRSGQSPRLSLRSVSSLTSRA